MSPVGRIKLYIDEDAMDSDLVDALRSRGLSVVTALDAGLIGRSDADQLTFAAANGCVLYTYNVSDFYHLHAEWLAIGRDHCGMILAPQQRFSVGEQLRRILRLGSSKAAAQMKNRVEFLGNWT